MPDVVTSEHQTEQFHSFLEPTISSFLGLMVRSLLDQVQHSLSCSQAPCWARSPLPWEGWPPDLRGWVQSRSQDTLPSVLMIGNCLTLNASRTLFTYCHSGQAATECWVQRQNPQFTFYLCLSRQMHLCLSQVLSAFSVLQFYVGMC